MGSILFFAFSMFMPPLLGFSIAKYFLSWNREHAYFSIGIGYLLGWFLTTVFLRLFDCLDYNFDVLIVSVIGYIASFCFLSIKIKRKPYEKVPQRIFKPGSVGALVIIILALLIYRWGLTLVDLTAKPVFPWDGWLSWSAKAKMFYEYQSIPSLYGGVLPFWEASRADTVFVNGASHPYFISLIQTYTATAWGSWDDNIVNLPWFFANISIAITVYGGLRLLGVNTLLSLCVVYAAVSLPIFDAHTSLGSYADMWLGFGLLVATFLLVLFFRYKKWQLLVLFLLFLVICYSTKRSAIFFFLAFAPALLWRTLGSRLSIILLTSIFGFILLMILCAPNTTEVLLKSFANQVFKTHLVYNPALSDLFEQWLVQDNWHFLFTVVLGSLVFWFVGVKNKKLNVGLVFLIVIGLMFFFIMLAIVFFSYEMSVVSFLFYINRITLHIALVLVLLPACTYCAMEDERFLVVHDIDGGDNAS